RTVLEFLRVIDESQPEWWMMENVRNVPDVAIDGYTVQRIPVTDSEFGGRQRRLRHVQFGSRVGHIIRPLRTSDARPVTPAIMCARRPGDRHGRRLAAMGAPPLPLRSLTPAARARAIGNGVPWAMGTALARSVTLRGPR